MSIANSIIMAAGAKSKSTFPQQQNEKRIKKMKMSGYFRRPKAQQLERRHTTTTTAQILVDYSNLNADLEELNKPVVKLRL